MNKVILLIDDNEGIREMLASVLGRACNVSVIQAVDGLDGLDKAISMKIDLIITDCDMPKMNGLEFTKALKAVKVDLPVVMFSGSDTAKETFIRSLGGTAFFEKTEVGALTDYTKGILKNDVA